MEIKAIATDGAPRAIGPYSQAIEAGGFLFCSGQIPLKPNGEMVEGGIEEQAKQVMENLAAVLKAAGLSMNNLVKTTIYLSDLNDFVKVNDIYGAYFEEPFPARATVEVAALPKGAMIEIEAVAGI